MGSNQVGLVGFEADITTFEVDMAGFDAFDLGTRQYQTGLKFFLEFIIVAGTAVAS